MNSNLVEKTGERKAFNEHVWPTDRMNQHYRQTAIADDRHNSMEYPKYLTHISPWEYFSFLEKKWSQMAWNMQHSGVICACLWVCKSEQ